MSDDSLVGTHWRHKENGLIYEIIADTATLECSTAKAFEEQFEDDHWIIYRGTRTGAWWVRPRQEFLDGRFEQVADV